MFKFIKRERKIPNVIVWKLCREVRKKGVSYVGQDYGDSQKKNHIVTENNKSKQRKKVFHVPAANVKNPKRNTVSHQNVC